MVLTAADKEMVQVHNVLCRGGAGAPYDDDEANGWGVYNSLRSPYMDVLLELVHGQGVQMLGNLYAAVHLFYVSEDDVYAEAWAEYVGHVMPAYAVERGWTRLDAEQRPRCEAWDFSPGALEDLQGYWRTWVSQHRHEDHAQLNASNRLFNRHMLQHQSMVLNGVQFKKGDWIMARPNAANGDLGVVKEPDAGLPTCGCPGACGLVG